MLTLDKIYHAAFVLKDVARKTDLIEAPKLSKDCQLYLKTENLQATGSFKVRGAYYKISQLSEEESVVICNGRYAAEVLSDGFETQPAADASWTLPGVVSRKKQFIPALMTAYQEL